MQFDYSQIREETAQLPTGTDISDHRGSRMFLISDTGSVNLEVGSLPAPLGGGDDFKEFNWRFDHSEEFDD